MAPYIAALRGAGETQGASQERRGGTMTDRQFRGFAFY